MTEHGSGALVYDLYQQGRERLDQGQAVAAAEVLELAVEHEPQKASLYEILGRAYFASGRLSSARTAFVQALELDPTDAYAHFGVGRCCERQGHLAEAVTCYRLASALSPRPDYSAALARVLARLDPDRGGQRRGGS